MDNLIITIARGYGSNGKAIGKKLAGDLGITFYDRNIISEASNTGSDTGFSFGFGDEKLKFSLAKSAEDNNDEAPEKDIYVADDKAFNFEAQKIREIADKESCVIVGRCADNVLKRHGNLLRVYIYASPKYCIKTIMKMYGVSPSEAERLIKQTDKERSEYYKHFTGNEWNNFSNYDLALNVASLGIDGCVEVIKEFIKNRR